MARYILRRLIQAIPIIIGISLISFFIVYLAPGDPFDRFRSNRVSPEVIENLRRIYGLDQPLPIQFFKWFTSFWSFPWDPTAWG
jgi:peptide/nickel transport system permease protein